MYKPELRLLKTNELNPISFAEFTAKLKNMAVNNYKLNPDTILPARSVCSDESEDQVIYALASYFGNNPFDFGRVGGLIATDRTPAAAHHGKDIVCVAATHVGYDPKVENVESRFGRMYRVRMGLTKEDEHAYSTCCGKLVATITPFMKLYSLASNRKVNLIKKTIEGVSKNCIVINNHILTQNNEGLVLNLKMERLIRHVGGHPVRVGGRANSTIFEASSEFVQQIKNPENYFKLEKPTAIGKMLSAEYFTFEQSNIPEQEDGSHLILKNILPYMNIIVSHPIPELAAANITIAHEFSKTVTVFRTKQQELDIKDRSILFVAGINLDVFDHELAEENPLLGHQVYFCPFAAFYKSRDEPYGHVLEKEELEEVLAEQSSEAKTYKIDELIGTKPSRLDMD